MNSVYCIRCEAAIGFATEMGIDKFPNYGGEIEDERLCCYCYEEITIENKKLEARNG